MRPGDAYGAPDASVKRRTSCYLVRVLPHKCLRHFRSWHESSELIWGILLFRSFNVFFLINHSGCLRAMPASTLCILIPSRPLYSRFVELAWELWVYLPVQCQHHYFHSWLISRSWQAISEFFPNVQRQRKHLYFPAASQTSRSQYCCTTQTIKFLPGWRARHQWPANLLQRQHQQPGCCLRAALNKHIQGTPSAPLMRALCVKPV